MALDEEATMDQEVVKELLEVSGVGACKFCGQINIPSYNTEYESPEQANECATFKCSCTRATMYANRKLSLKRAEEQIEDLFGDGACEYGLISAEVVINDLMLNLATLVYDDALKDITINISASSKVKISKSAKGKLNFMRSEANVIKKEV